MHGYSRVIRYHPVILRRVSAPESAYLGRHIYRTPNIRPSARQPLNRPFRVEKNRPTPKRGFPVQSNFFAVVSNPNTQAESTGIIKSIFWAPVHGRRPPKAEIRTPTHRNAEICSRNRHIFSGRNGGANRPPKPHPTGSHRFPTRTPGFPMPSTRIAVILHPHMQAGSAGGRRSRCAKKAESQP